MPTIRVTQADIERGVPGKAFLCPVARAIRRAFNANPACVAVGRSDVSIVLGSISADNYECFDVTLPPKAREFVRAFDTDQPVQPFTFRLKVPV